MDKDQIEAIKTRLAAITNKGEWWVYEGNMTSVSYTNPEYGDQVIANTFRSKDAVFIASAPATIAALIAEVERLGALLADETRRADQLESELAVYRAVHLTEVQQRLHAKIANVPFFTPDEMVRVLDGVSEHYLRVGVIKHPRDDYGEYHVEFNENPFEFDWFAEEALERVPKAPAQAADD